MMPVVSVAMATERICSTRRATFSRSLVMGLLVWALMIFMWKGGADWAREVEIPQISSRAAAVQRLPTRHLARAFSPLGVRRLGPGALPPARVGPAFSPQRAGSAFCTDGIAISFFFGPSKIPRRERA